MKSLLAALAISLFTSTASARTYDEVMADAQAAFARDDFPLAAELLDEAQVLRPYSFFLTRNRVLARILSGKMDEAITLTKEIADRGVNLELPPNEAFDRMRADPHFILVAEQFARNAVPKGVAVVAAEFPESGVLPEAISKSGKRLLIGSVRTGEIFDAKDNLKRFAKLNGGIFDVEQRKEGVFAAVNNQLAFEGEKEPVQASVVWLDPTSADEIERYSLGPGPTLIGDIEISKRGCIFASDSLTPRIFRLETQISEMSAKPEAFTEIKDDRFVNLQGLALDEKSSRLYVADYLAGLFAINLETGSVSTIENPTGAHLGGIDGLYFHKGNLIGVQNGVSPQRLVRIKLDKGGRRAELLEVLQQGLQGWAEPTHGYVERNAFYYIATSNWPAYDDDGNLRANAQLWPLKIMKSRLD